jgi:hypothetical protein
MTTTAGAEPSRRLRWLLGRGGLGAAFAWGIAEGSLFFIVPDVLLTLAALFSFRIALLQTSAVVAGALVAGAMMFAWALHFPEQAKTAVLAVPLVRPAMAEKVRDNFTTRGVVALLLGPASGIPYKLYAVEAPKHVSLPLFLLASIPARLERLLIGVLLFGAAGALFRARIARHPGRAAAAHAIYWVGAYTYYWTAI